MNNIYPFELSLKIFEEIGKNGFLLASGNINHFNSMTVGWASIGYLWRMPMAFVYVRPQRYTFEFMEQYKYFSLNFFEPEYKSILQLFGTQSGRNFDKMNYTKIKALPYDNKTIYYHEAKLVFICKKVYYQDLKSELFIDKKHLNNYPLNDFHRIYYGEIIHIFTP